MPRGRLGLSPTGLAGRATLIELADQRLQQGLEGVHAVLEVELYRRQAAFVVLRAPSQEINRDTTNGEQPWANEEGKTHADSGAGVTWSDSR